MRTFGPLSASASDTTFKMGRRCLLTRLVTTRNTATSSSAHDVDGLRANNRERRHAPSSRRNVCFNYSQPKSRPESSRSPAEYERTHNFTVTTSPPRVIHVLTFRIQSAATPFSTATRARRRAHRHTAIYVESQCRHAFAEGTTSTRLMNEWLKTRRALGESTRKLTGRFDRLIRTANVYIIFGRACNHV